MAMVGVLVLELCLVLQTTTTPHVFELMCANVMTDLDTFYTSLPLVTRVNVSVCRDTEKPRMYPTTAG